MPAATDAVAAYAWCAGLARSHYENFPVASRLLPRALRRPVSVVYAFARIADDYADEGDATADQRIAALDAWEAQLDRLDAPTHPVFIALADARREHDLPLQYFRHLVEAFRMDVRHQRWPDVDAVLHYCRHSANPVGRLLLHLSGAASPDNLQDSDAICTALQLINFWQDLGQDLDENDRIYLPADEMQRYGVTEAMLRERRAEPALLELLAFQRERARGMLLEGAPLARRLRGRMGLELRVIVQGGLRILEKLDANAHDPWLRPRLHGADWPLLLARALRH